MWQRERGLEQKCVGERKCEDGGGRSSSDKQSVCFGWKTRFTRIVGFISPDPQECFHPKKVTQNIWIWDT